jgi:predicted RNA-binding protein with EMAP domain
MKVEISEDALHTLKEISDFVESKNTKGAGKRWLLKFKKKIKEYAKQNVKYKYCDDETLFELKFSCLLIGNWIIVFNIENNCFKIYQLIHGSLIK